jgi:hypothetical protein
MLSSRAINRATLSRQLLLRRASLRPEQAIAQLVGMQAQAPFPPYTGLWTRLAGFEPDDLGRLLLDRAVVRIALMRSTVHLVTADDCLALRPVLQPMLERTARTQYARQLTGVAVEEIVDAGRELVEEQPRDTAELARLLMRRWPDVDRNALLNVVRAALPLVQLPPRAVWGRSGRTIVTTAGAWLGRPVAYQAAPDDLVRRFFAAFGPASVADAQKWSGLTRLREVVDRLRPGLRVFRDEVGVELFDVPDAPRPAEDTAAPVRFLPEFDNLLLAYADGRRVLAPERRPAVFTVNGIIRATVLVDGFAEALWKVTTEKGAAVLEIQPFERLPARARAAVESEGARLLEFAAADATTRDVRIIDSDR